MSDKCHPLVLLVKSELLVDALGIEVADKLLTNRTVEFSELAGRRMARVMTQTVRKYKRRPELLENSFEVRSLESRLLETLSGCLALSDSSDHPLPVSKRRATVRSAISYAERSSKPITAFELAIAAGVSQRTLELAFRDAFDTTPGTYLRFHRMNGAHRDLLTADPQVSSVTEIAHKWGFTHPSRFSSMHRELFGEVPSLTLRRSRTSPGSWSFPP